MIRRAMNSNRVKYILICLLVLAGMVGCGGGPEVPTTQTTPAQSSSGIVVQLTEEELTAQAELILVGHVSDVSCYEEGEGTIYTEVTISVEQKLKGEAGGEVVIRVAGGKVGEQVVWVEDAPSFDVGERVVVFLEEYDSALHVVGGFQGKYTVSENDTIGSGIPLPEFLERIEGHLEMIRGGG